MNNDLFVVSPLYIGVGFVIAVLVCQELLRGLPRHHAVRQRHHRHKHRPA